MKIRCGMILFASACLLVIMPASARASVENATKRILVLYSFDQYMTSIHLIEQGIREMFARNALQSTEFYTEYMERRRFLGEDALQEFRRFCQHRYGNRKIDLVITVMGPGLRHSIRGRAVSRYAGRILSHDGTDFPESAISAVSGWCGRDHPDAGATEGYPFCV